MSDCEPTTCENGKCQATGECIDVPEKDNYQEQLVDAIMDYMSNCSRVLAKHRLDIIEAIAQMLETSYPDNANTNAFCAAIRSMKEESK